MSKKEAPRKERIECYFFPQQLLDSYSHQIAYYSEKFQNFSLFNPQPKMLAFTDWEDKKHARYMYGLEMYPAAQDIFTEEKAGSAILMGFEDEKNITLPKHFLKSIKVYLSAEAMNFLITEGDIIRVEAVFNEVDHEWEGMPIEIIDPKDKDDLLLAVFAFYYAKHFLANKSFSNEERVREYLKQVNTEVEAKIISK